MRSRAPRGLAIVVGVALTISIGACGGDDTAPRAQADISGDADAQAPSSSTTTTSTSSATTTSSSTSPDPQIRFPATCTVDDIAESGSLPEPLAGSCAALTGAGQRLVDGSTLLTPGLPEAISRCRTGPAVTLWLRYLESDGSGAAGWVEIPADTDLDLDPVGPAVTVQDRRGSDENARLVPAHEVNDDIGQLVFEIDEAANGIVATCFRDVSRESDVDAVSFRWSPTPTTTEP